MPEKVSFKTTDEVKIIGNWFIAPGADTTVLLLHMRPADKDSWNEFAARLNAAGLSALAIDLRGHGESVEQDGKKIDYRDFPGGSHADCRKDIDAAMDFLNNNGVKNIYVVGGSIGANLAIDAMARYGEMKKGVALSPGLEYLEVSAENVISKITNNLFLAASADDDYSYKSVKKLHELNPRTEIKLYDDAGHATKMFSKYPELMGELVKWLKN